METIKEALDAVERTSLGLLYLQDPRGNPSGAIVNLATMEEMAREQLIRMKIPVKKKPTRKERKDKAARRQFAECKRLPQRTGVYPNTSIKWTSTLRG